jgi:CCR4-NOT transcription complex subunit 6
MEECQSSQRSTKPGTVRSAGDAWLGLDLSSQGVRNISRYTYDLTFIRELYLNNNEIETIPKGMAALKSLEILNLSRNKIKNIPAEIGRIVTLKELYLNDNLISNVPMELGALYNLEIFNISNNPLVAPFSILCKDRKLLQFCREHNTSYPMPNDRTWIECANRSAFYEEGVSIGTFNILCNFYASRLTYAPSWVLNPEFRKEAILQEITSYNVDILCLQEIEVHNFLEFYKGQLEMRCEYESILCPKGRSRVVADKRNVDGCAVFWKRGRFSLVESFQVDFLQRITQDERFCRNQELLSRYGRRDNVALVVVLEMPSGHSVVVTNVHVFWDPEFPDVKLLQTLLLLEELTRIRQRYRHASLLLAGDFNSLRDSSVYKSIVGFKADTLDFGNVQWGLDNFSHPLRLYDAYSTQDLSFTNFTPSFKGTIDYIFYGDGLTLTSVLSPVEDEYTEGVVGLPSIHFPSDHIFTAAKFALTDRGPAGARRAGR